MWYFHTDFPPLRHVLWQSGSLQLLVEDFGTCSYRVEKRNAWLCVVLTSIQECRDTYMGLFSVIVFFFFRNKQQYKMMTMMTISSTVPQVVTTAITTITDCGGVAVIGAPVWTVD